MSMYARVVADNTFRGRRLTSLELLYPTAIHGEVLLALHDVQAITVAPRTAEEVFNEVSHNEFCPEVSGRTTVFGERGYLTEWKNARANALGTAYRLMRPPEPVNATTIAAVLAPFSHTRVLVTAESWRGLGPVGCSWEMERLRECVFQTLAKSTPEERAPGDWHFPYLSGPDIDRCVFDALSTAPPGGYTEPELVKHTITRCQQVSGVRIARVSDDLDVSACLVQESTSHAQRHHALAGDKVPGWLKE